MPRLVIVLAAFWMGLTVGGAWGQEIHHHAGKSSAIDRFYSTWMKPNKPTESCCSHTDCDWATVKVIDGEYWAKRDRDVNWIRIPPETVEHHRDSPDARAHLCRSNYTETVYCFIAPSGG